MQAAAGTSAEFSISVGLHQCAALLPFLFFVVMDAVTRDLGSQALLYADDVMLESQHKEDIEWQAQVGSENIEYMKKTDMIEP